MPKARIVIIIHEEQEFDRGFYLHRIAFNDWAHHDIETVVHRGTRNLPDADLAILHVDLTELPEAYTALAANYPRMLNAGSGSIAKRAVSTNLVSAEDDYDGPVVVKTDANHLGHPELNLYRQRVKRSWNPIDHIVWRYRRSVQWRERRLPNDEYLFLDRKHAVPDWVWTDKRFVVEAFRPQFDGTYYHLNYWFFLGTRNVVFRVSGTQPHVTAYDQSLASPFTDRVPGDLERRREELGLDFGKLDFLISDGEVVLIDASRTPSAGQNIDLERRVETCRLLAPGILDFL